jgi:hypothetical protein
MAGEGDIGMADGECSRSKEGCMKRTKVSKPSKQTNALHQARLPDQCEGEAYDKHTTTLAEGNFVAAH